MPEYLASHLQVADLFLRFVVADAAHYTDNLKRALNEYSYIVAFYDYNKIDYCFEEEVCLFFFYFIQISLLFLSYFLFSLILFFLQILICRQMIKLLPNQIKGIIDGTFVLPPPPLSYTLHLTPASVLEEEEEEEGAKQAETGNQDDGDDDGSDEDGQNIAKEDPPAATQSS